MNIIRYQARLNSGRIITEASHVGSELAWDSLHWSGTPNRITSNSITLEENEKGTLLHADISMELQSFTETMCFSERNPIVIELDAKAESEIVAYYYFKDWWTRPAFVSSFSEVPDETSILFYRAAGEYHFLLALPGKVFRAHFEGMEGCENLCLILSADSSGYTSCRETAMLAVSDADPYRCMEKGMQYAAELYQIPLRKERTFPELFEKIGWCSWDAFYKEVNEDGLTAKAEEIRDKKLPFGWMIIDDGWQDYVNERMVSYGTNKVKFPNGLAGATEKIREICGIDQIGVWHAFSGYWCGIDPEGPLVKEHPERFMTTRQGKCLPKPDAETAYEFYGDWYKELKEQGISFVKVDSQSSTRQHYRTNTPTGETCAALHKGLDRATADYLNEGLINCMGLAMENVLQRPTSGVSRNSDDFFPLEEESFKEHLLENVFNTIWHNVIYYGDWDMFWSTHPYAQKHALLRALSGGPVYVSDRVGDTVRDVLMPLCYEDGTLLRAEKGCVPVERCLLQDPAKSGYIILQNIFNSVGYLAVYSYKDEAQSVKVKMSDLAAASSMFGTAGADLAEAASMFEIAGADLAGIEPADACRFAVWDVFGGTGFVVDGASLASPSADFEWTCDLEANGCRFYQVAPIRNGIAVFGRADKYLSSHTVTGREDSADGCEINIREMGPVLIYADRMTVCKVNGEFVEVTEAASEGFRRIEMPVKEEKAEMTVSFLK